MKRDVRTATRGTSSNEVMMKHIRHDKGMNVKIAENGLMTSMALR